jgi:hypothetical protein
MPGMHRHTLQVWKVYMYIYVFPPKRKKEKKKEHLPESCEHRDFGKDDAIASEAEAHAARRREMDFLTRILTPRLSIVREVRVRRIRGDREISCSCSPDGHVSQSFGDLASVA